MATIAVLMLVTTTPAVGQALPTRKVGMWYSTWWTDAGHYIWSRGHGALTPTQLLADVNGDGKADAVSVDTVNGDWYVSLSDGSKFGAESRWITGFGVGTNAQFLADVNGDGKADAVTVDTANGAWYVALSTGSGFASPVLWSNGFGVGTSKQLVADVNGDGKADAVTFDKNTGDWWVALSTGSGFAAPTRWISGHGVGSNEQFLADANGDGRADAITVDTTNGDWYVSLSTGTSFGAEGFWLHGFGIGDRVMMGDVTGDGKADAIAYVASSPVAGGGSAWYRAAAQTVGTCSGGQTAPCFSVLDADTQPWKTNLGNSPTYHFRASTPHTPATWTAVADVRGAGIGDPVAFHDDSGIWQVLPSVAPPAADPYPSPQLYNRWDAYDVPYLPITHGVPSQYDSADPSVITEQLGQISAAGIDYLLFDLTNGFGTDDIYLKAKTVCQQIDQYDRAGHKLRFAVAIGNHTTATGQPDPAKVEAEAAQVETTFATDPVCHGRYQTQGSKPLLVLFDSWNTRLAWQQYTPKTNTAKFTVQWASGRLPECKTGGCPANYPSRDQQGCPGGPPVGQYPPPTKYGQYVGWGTAWGSVGNGPDMTVMPGWNTIGNPTGNDFVSRTQYGAPDGFYTHCAWNRVLAASPRPTMVVIASYNEFIEETAIQPADTSQVVPCQYCSEAWPSPTRYWDITTADIAAYRSA